MRRSDLPTFDRRAAIRALEVVGLSVASGVRTTRARSGNEVLRLDTEAGTFFLKAPSKDLDPWPDPLDGAAAKVAREQAASLCLRRHGLPGPEVLVAELGCDNPLGRPYLLTRCVPGRPFTTVVPRGARQRWKAPLRAVGAFLAAAHRIVFAAAGFVTTPQGPVGAVSPARALTSHASDVAQADALRDLDNARPFLDGDLAARLETRFSTLAASIDGEYHPPRLVIGGFHPNHPFLARTEDEWSVVGCIDLEVTSGGRVFDDLATFAVGMMFRFDPDIPWWEPLFEGYGSAPQLESFRMELLGHCSYLFGGRAALGATYRRLLGAQSWATLFNVHRPA